VLAARAQPSPLEALPRTGSVLAFDFGEARIGVAVGDLALRIPHAIGVIPSVPRAERYRAAGNLMDEWQPVLLAVGVPAGAENSPHPLVPAIERFARSLEGRFRLPVARVDESFSSCAASEALRASGIRGRAQKSRLDAAAAAEILALLFSQIDDAAA
jgi:putative Holliday junction resolvase